MYVSLHLSPQSRGAEDDAEIIAKLADTAVEAERHGVASIGLTEHHLAGYNTYVDSFMMGAHLAARLTTAHLSLTVVQMALHHPLRVVEKTNLLDNLMRGRLMVALAPGSASPVELGAFGVESLDRNLVTAERIEAAFRAWEWDGDSAGVDVGTSVDRGVVTGRISPAPYRLPRPLIGRATRTPATIQRLGAEGIPAILGQWLTKDGDNREQLALYEDALLAGGHDDAIAQECLRWLGFGLTIVVAPTQAEAERRWSEYVELGGEGPQPGKLGGADEWRAEWTRREVARASGSLVGDPSRIVEEIQAMEAAGARHVRIIPALPANRLDDRDEIFDLIFSEILPHVGAERLPEPSRTRQTASSALV
ncbi:LLM class flavin-dependent oxidoreductase [Aeromicrobium choanae]|uniref:Flavin-dependent oxidoreductase, luciferase family (Includes alkanesulfonate monooxygenase SsuD and methylene tetrahydromethanopterin reductase) n=1 Tax=Aeromicrobium choanae TaxID=1736691 RepID=A0A1T4YWB3_9ACTN|nr:LLM class flavin-dependent oxidoreductase [Aeromicrobium choanae]SKB05923.1 Flavin-dependent oxidoreductase, luciferase family (includes alkanesulfonate monooxygenase SsuD and methylene tetrahydromethanopterin reductase) [Aeromicrobium choanae]